MEKRIVQWLSVASAATFATAVGLAAFARPFANQLITAIGIASAGLAVVALAMFLGFKLAEFDARR